VRLSHSAFEELTGCFAVLLFGLRSKCFVGHADVRASFLFRSFHMWDDQMAVVI
jgi:hypothetical protein